MDATRSTTGSSAREAQALRQAQYLSMDMLRLITCGSVDDGKSTLIGRLLYDTKSIHQDQWEAVHKTSIRRGNDRIDLALLTDGLRAEREQGITIDVAYRYFSTPKRKFILADTPGHVQYTRNMVTGASTAELALILIDARQGVLEQTRRHSYLVALLGIKRLVVCVNKMDLVGWDRATFDRICADFRAFTESAGGAAVFEGVESLVIPLSALEGDNVVRRSEHTPWYSGPTLLEHLEATPAESHLAAADAPGPDRFLVQWVVRPQREEFHDYRGYAGRMLAGRLRVGDEVVAHPSGRRSRVARIHLLEDFGECIAPQSVTVTLDDDIDAPRGEMFVPVRDAANRPQPLTARDLDATIVWMSTEPLVPSRKYVVKHGARYVRAVLGPVKSRLNIHALTHDAGAAQLGLNEIGRVAVRLAAPIVHDPYRRCRETGSFIVIDESTNGTVGAGLIESAAP
ncbi:MAG: GTP-binding protein [Phycisphaerales bacterium]